MASPVPLDIKAPENDYNFQHPYVPAAFNNIVKFLNKEIDVSTAAELVTEPVALYTDCEPQSPVVENVPLGSDDDGNSTETKFSVEGYLWSLWGMLNEIVKQIPHDHSWLDDIVDLLAAIKLVKLPPTKENLLVWGEKFQWIDLPIFGPNTREDFDRFMPDDTYELEECPAFLNKMKVCSAQQFASFAAFLAKITVQAVADYKLYAIWMLRDTLEEKKTPRGLDTHTPAATTWILYAGELIYKNNEMYEYGPCIGDRARAGELWLEKSKHGFCLERWNFWKQRFLQIASTYTDIQPETIRYAMLAVAKMNEIEENHKMV